MSHVAVSIKEFEREMLKRTRKWSDCAEELSARPGLRAVMFSADLLRAAILSGTVKEWLTQLFEQLPEDVAVMDLWPGSPLVSMMPGVSCPTDTYFFVVGSKVWPPPEEGTQLQSFTAVFKREWACTKGCGYEQNPIERPTCEVCGRGRGA